jgi:hypothetical protein
MKPKKPNRIQTKKTEPNRKKIGQNQAKPKKPSQTGLNRFLSKKTEPKPVNLKIEPVSVFFKKNSI